MSTNECQNGAGASVKFIHAVTTDYKDEDEFIIHWNFGEPFRVRIDRKKKKISLCRRPVGPRLTNF